MTRNIIRLWWQRPFSILKRGIIKALSLTSKPELSYSSAPSPMTLFYSSSLDLAIDMNNLLKEPHSLDKLRGTEALATDAQELQSSNRVTALADVLDRSSASSQTSSAEAGIGGPYRDVEGSEALSNEAPLDP
ncbi:MAG: hypothetical protein Q9214_007954, partial [Letrouitia sp. 1 TL-2023]